MNVRTIATIVAVPGVLAIGLGGASLAHSVAEAGRLQTTTTAQQDGRLKDGRLSVSAGLIPWGDPNIIVIPRQR